MSASEPARVAAGANVATFALAALLALAVAALARSDAEPSGSAGCRIEAPRHRVDLSTASVAELALLPEVGPSLAARIAADRAARGPFRSVDGLARVEGFGAARIEALREDARAGDAIGRER